MKIGNGDNGDTPPPPMRAPGSREMAAGLMLMLISVSVGINSGAGGMGLLSFLGVLAGVFLVIAGVRAADVGDSAPVVPAVLDGTARGLVSFTRRHLALVGLALASSAVAAVSGEAAGPVLCSSMFVVLLLGVYMIGVGTLGE